MKRIFFGLSLLILVACGSKKIEDPKEEAPAITNDSIVSLTVEQSKNAGIELGKVETKKIATVLKVNGRIDVPPQNMVSISVPLGGYLKSSALLPGMHVNKGQTLALMEDAQYIQLQQDYLTAKTRLVYAEQEYNRQKELNASKASSDKVLQQAQAELGSQQILLVSLAEKLRLININPAHLSSSSISRVVSVPSPISGFVSKVNVNIGKYVNPADALFEIVNPDDIHLALFVFEKDVNKLYIDQPLIAFTNTNRTKKYPCKIILISKDISSDKTFEVHCHFEKYDKELLPGMFMNAEIEAQSLETAVLPSDAIVRFQNKSYVFVQRQQNVYEMLEVITGSSENGFTAIEVHSDIQNLPVVIKGSYGLLMKMKNTAED